MSINTVELKANAKINLTLEVLFRREDGYHELRSVMHSVGISDTLRLEKAEAGVISIECDEALPYNNTARRAAELFIKETVCGGVRIAVKKAIPSEAGMGGASADAAGVLLGMELLYGKLEQKRLYEIGKSIGADVPFCLHGGCALACGIGEKLTPLEPVFLPLLIVKPSRGVSTAELFRSLTPGDMGDSCETADGMMRALSSGACAVSQKLSNALSPAAERLAPETARLRERLKAAGALGACMTGSGSAVFGIFKSISKAEEAKRSFSDCSFSEVCSTVPTPIELISLS